MTLIEEAAKRLEQIRRSGATTSADRPDPRQFARAELRTAEAAPFASQGQPAKASAPSRQITLDLKRLAAAGLNVAGTPRSALGDEFRVIKRPLLANASGLGAAPVKNGNLIMVT